MLGDECPEDKYLNKFVREEVCAACVGNPDIWKDLGIMLMGQKSVSSLKIIKANNRENVVQCCSEMFSLWRQRQPKANWKQLIRALKEVKLHTLAAKIVTLLLPPVKQQHTGDQLQTKERIKQVLEDKQLDEGIYACIPVAQVKPAFIIN